MQTVRRWYIFLVSFVALQAVAWAIIYLLRNLFIHPGRSVPVESVALQIAIIVVGLPIFLLHWWWGQRLAREAREEQAALLRRVYLYGALASFVVPLIANSHGLLLGLLQWILDIKTTGYYTQAEVWGGDKVFHSALAIVPLVLLWFYHRQVLRQDEARLAEYEAVGDGWYVESTLASVGRLYGYIFSGTGLTMAFLAAHSLLTWLLAQLGGSGAAVTDSLSVSAEAARLLVGVPLWLIFWQQGQRRFAADGEEQASVARKLYLYVTIFATALSTVVGASIILAGMLRQLLDLPPAGDISEPLALVVVAGVIWAYHARVLRRDVATMAEQPGQAVVRQIYLYLITAIGLAAFAIGLGGDVNVLIHSLAGDTFAASLREELAMFTASLVAGLPVWLLPWRQAQVRATAKDSAGQLERRSLSRKIYLYAVLFVATMTILSCAVYIVYTVVNRILTGAASGNLMISMAQAVSFGLIAAAVWAYHMAAIRWDGRQFRVDEAKRYKQLHVAVLDMGEGKLGHDLIARLHEELPGLSLQAVGLTPVAAANMNGHTPAQNPVEALAAAEVIVGPWSMAVPGSGGGVVSPEIAAAVAASPARKVLLPTREGTWEWAGVEAEDSDSLIAPAVEAIKQIAAGEEVRPSRRPGVGLTIALVVAGIPIAFLLVQLIVSLVMTLIR